MPIISFCNIKGGCGKTTGAVNFAAWLALKKKRVYLVDANEQGSSSYWLQHLKTPIAFSQIVNPDHMVEQLPELDEKYDFVVVDGVPEVNEMNKNILCFTDLCVSPIQPSGMDIQTFCSKTLRLINSARKISRGLPTIAAAYLSRAQARSSSTADAFSQLNQVPEIKLLKTIIYERKVVGDSFTEEATIWDFKKNKSTLDSTQKAVNEFNNLSKEIYGLIK